MKDQRGFTLVELLIGIVILSIVTAAVCSFIVVGSKSYAAANTEIMLQQEAQLALNQISDVIIDTTRSVNYAGYTEDGTPVFAVKDGDFTFEPQDKSLTMFNGAGTIKLDEDGKPIQEVDTDGSPKVDSEGNPVYEMDIESGRGNEKNYQFYWNKEDAKLYYSEIDVDQTNFPETVAEGQVVLAEYVTEFSIDLTQVEEKRVVQISMTFERDNKTYHTSNNITIRNKVRINDVDLEQLDKRVKLSVVPKENSVILEPGETYHFSTPLVSGQNVMDKSVTWSLSAETPPDDSATQFSDTTNGIINIASGETADSFKVVITTNAADSEGNHATTEVIVYVKRAKTVALSLDGGSKEITAGTTFTVNASVEGNRLGVSCGGCTDATTIDKYVIADEYPAYSWQILSGAEYVDIVSYDNKSADFKISASAQDGDEVVIQAASLLSAVKGYTKDGGSGIVYGTITLTVEGKESIYIDWSGDLLYGNASENGAILNMGYLNSDDPVFLICVRIKESKDAPIENDMVMVYATEGNNARVMPDTWLLDMNKDYYIYIQIINVLSDPALRDENMNKTKEYEELRKNFSEWTGAGNTKTKPEGPAYEYLKNYVEETFWPEYTSHLNSTTGSYNGTKYPEYSNLLQGIVERPRIGIESYLDNNKTHYDGVDAKTIYTVQKGSLQIDCHIGAVTSTHTSKNVRNSAYYNVYKGTGDYTEWKQLMYGVEDYSVPCDVKPSYAGTEGVNIENGKGDINKVLIFDNLSNHVSANVQIDFNKDSNSYNNYNYAVKKQLVGTYHYAPAVMYANEPHSAYLKISDNYLKYEGKQYCYDYTSTFNFEVKDGGNFETPVWAYTDDGFQKGEIFFPVPSDPLQFPPQFRDSVEEVSIYAWDCDKTYLLDDKGNLHNPKFSEISCKYNASQNRYELKLYYDYTDAIWGVTKKCCAGTYYCEPDGDEWKFLNAGDYDLQLNAGNFDAIQIDASNASFVMDDGYGNLQNVKAYIPLPSDSKFTGNGWGDFGFKLQQEGEQVIEGEYKGYGFQYLVIGSTDLQKRDCNMIKCTYDKNTDTYTLELTSTLRWEWDSILNQAVAITDTIKVTCKSTDTKWTVVN